MQVARSNGKTFLCMSSQHNDAVVHVPTGHGRIILLRRRTRYTRIQISISVIFQCQMTTMMLIFPLCFHYELLLF